VKIKKGYTKTSLLLVIVIFSVIASYSDCSVMIQSMIENGDEFIWDAEYSYSFDDEEYESQKTKIIVDYIGSDFINYSLYYLSSMHPDLLVYRKVDNDYNIQRIFTFSSSMYPYMTLRNFPLGTTSTITNIPELHSVLPNLCFISTNWSENCQLFINGTYSNYQDYNIENPAESIFIYSNLYMVKGAFRKVCIFVHNFHDSISEEFKILNIGVEGRMEAVYLEDSGILASYELHLVSSDLNYRLDISVKLKQSSVELGLSKWSKLLIPVPVITIPYLAISTFGWGVLIYGQNKRRIDKKKEAIRKEKEIIELEEEIKEKQKNITEDYYFIEKCSFCLKEIPKGKNICPNCKGKK